MIFEVLLFLILIITNASVLRILFHLSFQHLPCKLFKQNPSTHVCHPHVVPTPSVEYPRLAPRNVLAWPHSSDLHRTAGPSALLTQTVPIISPAWTRNVGTLALGHVVSMLTVRCGPIRPSVFVFKAISAIRLAFVSQIRHVSKPMNFLLDFLRIYFDSFTK